MGTLNSCLKSKTLYRDRNANLTVGIANMQGLRVTQEDDHKIDFELSKHPGISFFGVFDGHGGDKTSKFLSDNIIACLNNLETLSDEVLKKAMLELDREFIDDSNAEVRDQGSTCVFCLVEKVKDSEDEFSVTCVNVGDSRAILVRKEGDCVALSKDHKPSNKEESKRIKAAGGNVLSNRVDGTLAVSRAFGDYNLKNNRELDLEVQKVIAKPDIMRATAKKGDALLICCDGIYENMDTKTVTKGINANYSNHNDPAKMLCQLFEMAVNSGSSDNMTGIFVHFEQNENYPKGPQFVPGPLFRGRKDQAFFEAFKDDALRAGYVLSPHLRLTAYHQDLMEVMKIGTVDLHPIKGSIMAEIKRLKPWEMSLENLAFLINSLNFSVVMSPQDTASCEAKGVDTMEKLRSTHEQSGLSSLGLSPEIVKNINILFSLWRSLPADKAEPAAPPS